LFPREQEGERYARYTPFFGLLTDNEGLKRESSRVRLLGFKGKLLTHPRQIDTVHRVFSPSEEDISASLRIIKAYEEAQAQGKGAASLDGKMIDVAMYRMGLETIAKAERIKERARQR
jgi:citrate lyase beta subunit